MTANMDTLLGEPVRLAAFGRRLAKAIRLGKRVLEGRPDLLEVATVWGTDGVRIELERLYINGVPVGTRPAPLVDQSHPDVVALATELQRVLPSLSDDPRDLCFMVQRHVATLSQGGSYRVPIWAERAVPDPNIDMRPLHSAIRAAGARLKDREAVLIYAPPWLQDGMSAHERLDLAGQWESFTDRERSVLSHIGDGRTGLRVRRLGHTARLERISQWPLVVPWSSDVVALPPDPCPEADEAAA